MDQNLNSGWTYHNRINEEMAGQTVLDFYTQRYPQASSKEWQSRIAKGFICLDGQPVAQNTRLQHKQTLTYRRPPWRESDVPRNIEILYEDEHILVVGKPSGLQVMPAGNFLENTLLHLLREPFGHAAPIHRLGRFTSGIVLCARSDIAKKRLPADLQEGRVNKQYRTLATGTEMPDQFEITQPIGRIPYPKIGYLYAATPDGKPSQTICSVLHRDTDQNQSFLHLDLITGRPHQIRIHLAAAGYPLVGDPLYTIGGLPYPIQNSERPPLPGDGGYHLHAHRLCFTHPATEQKMDITSPLPQPLQTPDEKT